MSEPTMSTKGQAGTSELHTGVHCNRCDIEMDAWFWICPACWNDLTGDSRMCRCGHKGKQATCCCCGKMHEILCGRHVCQKDFNEAMKLWEIRNE